MERYDLIPPEHAAIHESIMEWARWGQIHWHPQLCRSLERNYRPPPMYETTTPQMIPNLKLIYAIERLVVNAPKQFGTHLVYYYIRKLPPQATRKKLHLSKDCIVSHLHDAREYLILHLK